MCVYICYKLSSVCVLPWVRARAHLLQVLAHNDYRELRLFSGESVAIFN